ncbi:MAG: ABC transporter ATP-binding protein [Pseudomonadota bacterium]
MDTLSNMLTVRLFALSKNEDSLLTSSIDDAMHAEKAMEWFYFKIWLFYGYGFFLAQCFNLFLLIKGRVDGWVTIGDFALVLSLNFSIMDNFWKVSQDIPKFLKLYGRIRQGITDIMVQPDIVDVEGAAPLQLTGGTLTFEEVHFRYGEAAPIFQKKSVTIASGEKVGLVGYSGSGKTTFVNLILRLYEVTSGRILIDGQNIRKVTQDSLHASIGMIPQDPSLFHRKLMDNIRYGRPDASEKEVIYAAKKAHADDFIRALPIGYDSLVGERGVKLSGGQRQRVAIARAILKDAPILILDEATSALDSVTEKYIQQSLHELMQGRTTIVIAHRLSTLAAMDRILVFDKGQIIEDGPHDKLLKTKGHYAKMWQMQVQGFLPDEEGESRK